MNSRIADWDAWPRSLVVEKRTSDLAREAQLKILHELKNVIEAHEPSFRHQQNSSFDSGKANGLKIACMYIDIKIKELL